MSGVTTTGATVNVGLDNAPPGVLLWRALLQWLGGIGIIAMAIAVLPMLRVGGMQLFRMESSDRSEKVMPRAVQIVTYIGFIYVGFRPHRARILARRNARLRRHMPCHDDDLDGRILDP